LPRLAVGELGPWVPAVLWFGLGDVLTTAVGLSAGAVEANPTGQLILGETGLVGLAAAKIAILGGAYLAYRRVPWPQRAGIPAGLAFVGGAITAHNYVLLEAVNYPALLAPVGRSLRTGA
jgi:hypothetical protein